MATRGRAETNTRAAGKRGSTCAQGSVENTRSGAGEGSAGVETMPSDPAHGMPASATGVAPLAGSNDGSGTRHDIAQIEYVHS